MSNVERLKSIHGRLNQMGAYGDEAHRPRAAGGKFAPGPGHPPGGGGAKEKAAHGFARTLAGHLVKSGADPELAVALAHHAAGVFHPESAHGPEKLHEALTSHVASLMGPGES